MDDREIEKLNKLESENWWFLGRRDLMFRLIPEQSKSVLEMGCGCGKTLELLKEKGYAVEGLDISPIAAAYSKAKGLNIQEVSIERFSPKKQYDLVLLADVLEHVDDEEKCIQKANESLREGGHLLLTVPAFQFLYSTNDFVNHHRKRYEFDELKRLLERNGFDIVTMSYWNAFLFIPAAAFKLFKKYAVGEKGNSDLFQTPKPLNQALAALLVAENKAIASGKKMPFGVSVACLAQKKYPVNPASRTTGNDSIPTATGKATGRRKQARRRQRT